MSTFSDRPILPPLKVDAPFPSKPPREKGDESRLNPPSQARFTWQANLEAYCRQNNIQPPEYKFKYENNYGKVCWTCVVHVHDEKIPVQRWYNLDSIEQAKEDAANVAWIKLDGNKFPTGRLELQPLNPAILQSQREDKSAHHLAKDLSFLNREIGKINQLPRYRCEHCDLEFGEQQELDSHVSNHSFRYQCLHCRSPFTNSYDFEDHIKTHSRDSHASRDDLPDLEFTKPHFRHSGESDNDGSFVSAFSSPGARVDVPVKVKDSWEETHTRQKNEKYDIHPAHEIVGSVDSIDPSEHPFEALRSTARAETRSAALLPKESKNAPPTVKYRCVACFPGNKRTYSSRASFTWHVYHRHAPRLRYHCLIPECPWVTNRRDRIHEHLRSRHKYFDTLTPAILNGLKRLLPAPRECTLCAEPVKSWDEYLRCMCNHCQVLEGDDRTNMIRGVGENVPGSQALSQDSYEGNGPFEVVERDDSCLEAQYDAQSDTMKGTKKASGDIGGPQILTNDSPSSRVEALTDSGYGSYGCGRSTAEIPITYNRLDGIEESAAEMSIHDSLPGNARRKSTVCLDDSRTVYSASTVADTTKKGYVSVLAENLCEAISLCQPSNDMLERIYELLPELLKVFALSVGNQSSNQIHRDVMVFIHKYRMDIATSCRHLISDENPRSQGRNSPDEMSLADKMELWERNIDGIDMLDQGSPPALSEADNGFDEEIDNMTTDDAPEIEPNLPGIQAYKDLIQSSPAYTKMVSDLRRECLLVPAEPNAMENIHNAILRMLPICPKVSRRQQTETFQMTIKVDWSPLLFLREQEYSDPPDIAIGKVIALTGSSSIAQATTCADYLTQTWPSIGDGILELIQNALKNNQRGISSVTLTDKTRVSAWMDGAEHGPRCPLVVVVIGIASLIAEVGEVLAWLGSALRSSPYERGVAFTRPFVDDGIHLPHRPEHWCIIRFETSRDSTTVSANGQCWHYLFRNPVVAEGYPIPRRAHNRPGIDISLQMMAELAETSCVNPFHGRPFIKGFSTLLVPTEYSENTVMWHLLFNDNGNRISYLDGMKFAKVNMPLSGLQNVRHILGWCSEMRFYAGAHGASYDIKNSRLPKASGDSPFSNTSLSMGRIITDDITFSIGRKDIPVHLSRNGYVSKLKWISKKFVLLWDEGDKRGWLVNGTSALLHLVRTSLELDRMNEFACVSQFVPAKLKGANLYQPRSSTKILLNDSNLKLEMYPEGDGFIRFQDQVTKFYDLMEKMIDHQLDAMDHISIRDVSRSQLEGWDFHDLATERDPVWPRMANLDSTGRSWVDFVRSIRAVTLFGRGFGDIIRPVNNCSQWSRLPTGQSYLAVSHADIQEIIQAGHGDPYSTPVKLTDNIIWHIPEQSSEHCRCSKGKAHSDIVQVLLPSSMQDQLADKSFTYNEDTNGAFVFGYSSVHTWYWDELGDPSMDPIEVRSAPVSKASSISVSHDSGIGKSLGSPTSKDGESSTESSFNPSASERYFKSPGKPLRSISFSRNDSYQYKPSTSGKIYDVGILCALHRELKAVRMLLDSEHMDDCVPKVDPNSYVFGAMSGHNIVATCLPDGEYGTSPAAYVASNMKRSFPDIKFCLMVGIGGGVPSAKNDIRLGDVVVSKPIGSGVGVLPYDMQKTLEGGMVEMNGYLHPPPRHLRSTLSEMQSDPRLSKTALKEYLQEIGEYDETYGHPGPHTDILYAADYSHPAAKGTCSDCDVSRMVYRHQRSSDQPVIHYGTIASGNQVMKDAITRDKWGRDYEVLCFEMEAAGLMNIFPSLIIRGICDYCDSHKNKKWQNYAAATAAAFAKLLLSRVRSEPEMGDQATTVDTRLDSRKRPLGESSVENVAKQQRIYKPLSRAESWTNM